MDIAEQIRTYVSRNFLYSDGEYPFHNDASFLEEGIIASIGVLELVLFVEETFGVVIDDQEVTPEHFDSVSRLAEFVRGKMEMSG